MAGRASAMDTDSGVVTKEELNEQGEDDQQDFDIETQKALEEMDALQNEMDILSINGEAEQMKVEMEYIKQKKSSNQKRNEIIKKMPNFWINTFMNHPVTHSLIAEEEEDCMQYLQYIDIEDYDDIKSGFRIKFYFEKNPYFENDVLVKEFPLGTYGQAQGTKIEWKEGNDLAEKVLKKQPANKEPEQFKSAPMGVKQPSFFVWFTQTKVHPSEDRYSLHIKKDMWPNPLIYFVLPLEVHVNSTQERYGRDYPEIMEMIKSGEYEKKFGEMEKEAALPCDSDTEPCGPRGQKINEKSRRGEVQDEGELPLV